MTMAVAMTSSAVINSLFLFVVLQLSERGQARLDQIEDAAEKVRDFYRLVSELQGLLGRAEEGLNAQGMVGTEVEMIKQQLQEFKVGRTSFCWLSTCVCVCLCTHSVFVIGLVCLIVLVKTRDDPTELGVKRLCSHSSFPIMP